MGKEQHLTYFKVENFKRFDSLELTDIGQFNLIVGDNNVGKTSLLEALLVSGERRSCLSRFQKTLSQKGVSLFPKRIFDSKGEVIKVDYPTESFLKYLRKGNTETIKIEIKTSSASQQVSFNEIDEKEYEKKKFDEYYSVVRNLSNDNRYVEFYCSWQSDDDNDFVSEVAGLYEHYLIIEEDDLKLPLVTVSLSGNNLLLKAYHEYIGISRISKPVLINNLKVILPDLEDLESRKLGDEDHLMVGIKNQDKEFMPISVFGESVIRTTQIMLEISKWRGQRLMIDEIDTGIHHSRMKEFLKTVIKVAELNEVQLFMTTHSIECQQAFVEVFEDPEMAGFQRDARQFLLEDKNGSVVAKRLKYDSIRLGLEMGVEMRG